MIPYFTQPKLEMGPLTFHAFGALVVMAILVGSHFIRKRTDDQGLDADISYNMVTWVLVGGFIGSHLVEVLVYHPEKLEKDPWALLKVWEGMSSFGGYLGAITATILFFHRYLPGDMKWRYVDVVVWGFPFGWIFGRTGCTVALDHPGLPTTFFLGFMRKNGQAIHNLGLYEMLYTVLIALLFWSLRKRPAYSGFYAGLFCVLYGPVRFGLDMLRTADVHYGGLTPGQWGSIALSVLGLWLMYYRKQVGDYGPWHPRDAEVSAAT